MARTADGSEARGSEARPRYLRLSHHSRRHKTSSYHSRRVLLSIPAQSLSLFSHPAPPDKSIPKVSAVFTQPLAQITSYRLRPAGCGALSLRVNDLAGCPLAGGAEGGGRGSMKKKEKKEVGIHGFKSNKNI